MIQNFYCGEAFLVGDARAPDAFVAVYQVIAAKKKMLHMVLRGNRELM